MLFEFTITLKNRANKKDEKIGFYNHPIGEEGSYFEAWRFATEHAIELLSELPMTWYIDRIEQLL